MRAFYFLLVICSLVVVSAIHHVPLHSEQEWEITTIPTTSWPVVSASVVANPESHKCQFYFTTSRGKLVTGNFLRHYVSYYLHHRNCQGSLDLVPRSTLHQTWVGVEIFLITIVLVFGVLSIPHYFA